MEVSLDDMKNWDELPAPESYYPKYEHIEERYQSANGYTVKDYIRKNKATVTCGWHFLNPEQLSYIQNLYDLDYFYLKFTDNYNNRVIKKVFAHPIEGSSKFCDRETYEISLTSDVSTTFEEY